MSVPPADLDDEDLALLRKWNLAREDARFLLGQRRGDGVQSDWTTTEFFDYRFQYFAVGRGQSFFIHT